MRALLITLLSSLIAAGSLRACGICPGLSGNPLTLTHPRAIEIAIATRAALDRGAIRVASPGAGWNNRESSTGIDIAKSWLSQSDFAKHFPSTPSTIHIVLVDTSHTVVAHQRGGEWLYDPLSTASADRIVATTATSLRALRDGELKIAEAEKLGLLLIEERHEIATRSK